MEWLVLLYKSVIELNFIEYQVFVHPLGWSLDDKFHIKNKCNYTSANGKNTQN